LHRAYNVARPGEVVAVAAGRYPGETVRDLSGGKTAPSVVIEAASGASVSFTGPLELDNARHLTLRNLTIEGFPAYWSLDVRCTSNLTLENVGGGRRLHISRSENVLVKGGWWGNYSARGEQDSHIGHGGPNCMPAQPGGPSRNVMLDGVTFRDVFWGKTLADFLPESHPDCLQLDEVDGLTIRNSRFLRCAQVFIGYYGDGVLNNLLVENTVLAKVGTDSYYGTVIEDYGKPGACSNVVFRNNTHDESGGNNPLSAQGFGFLRIFCKGSGVRVVGNILHTSPRAGSCGLNGAVWSHNVYERPDLNGFLCGAANLLAPGNDAGFVDRAGNDYHLTASSPALDRGSPGDYAATDFDGQLRFWGAAPDAGADER
jgi:hypothetical protein